MFRSSFALVIVVAYVVYKAGQRHTETRGTAWVLIVTLGFICVIGFYLFWPKTSGNCESCRVLLGSVAFRSFTLTTKNFMDLRLLR
jgi:hypothetical protein